MCNIGRKINRLIPQFFYKILEIDTKWKKQRSYKSMCKMNTQISVIGQPVIVMILKLCYDLAKIFYLLILNTMDTTIIFTSKQFEE